MVFVLQYFSGISTKTTKLITTKGITDIDMTETEENPSTPKITLNQSITAGSMTATEIPTTNIKVMITSNATPTSDPSNFIKLNHFV